MRQKRVIAFVFDGTGLGHLRRMARIAAELQGNCAVLFVAGMREAAWIAPESCEVFLLPSLNSMRGGRGRQLGKSIWLDIDINEVMAIRRGLLRDVFKRFQPDAVLVDYLPFGRKRELLGILSDVHCLKYFVLRGVVDTADFGFLSGKATDDIAALYDRIFVTCDMRVVDVISEYSFTEAAAAKTVYVGYVGPSTADHLEVRRNWDIDVERSWVVCSGGGGLRSHDLFVTCQHVAHEMPHVQFDIVCGPLSRSMLSLRPEVRNCRVSRELRDLPDLHAAADIVVNHGGYNTMIEAAVGGARLIVFPSQKGDDDEQLENAKRLGHFYPVEILNRVDDLGEVLSALLAQIQHGTRSVFPYSVDGSKRLKRIMLADLGVD